jgi:hypothetical protein
MFNLPMLDVLLWTCAIAGSVWALIPPLFAALGLGSVRLVADEDPTAATPPDEDESGTARFEQLRSLGFRPLGTAIETVWFLAFIHWVKRFESRRLGTPDGKCFASLYRLSAYEPVRVCLSTITTGRGMVSTTMPGVGHETDEPTYVRAEVEECEAAELLARHKHNVARFVSERGLAVISETLEGYASVREKHTRSQWRKIGPLSVFLVVIFFVGGFFILPGLLCLDFLLWWFQGQGIARAVSLVFATAVYYVVVTWIWPRITARRRIERRQSKRKESLEDPCPAKPPAAELVRSAASRDPCPAEAPAAELFRSAARDAAIADAGERWLRPSAGVVLWIGALGFGHLCLIDAAAYALACWNGVVPVLTVAELCGRMAAYGVLLAAGFAISWLRHRRVAWHVGPDGIAVYHGDTLRRAFGWAEVVSLKVHRAVVIARLASRPFKERLQWPDREGAVWLREYARERLGDRMDGPESSGSMAEQRAEPSTCPTCTATLKKGALLCERCGTIHWSDMAPFLLGSLFVMGVGALALWGSYLIAWPVVSGMVFVLGLGILAIFGTAFIAVLADIGRARQLGSSWRRKGALTRTDGNGDIQDGPGQ